MHLSNQFWAKIEDAGNQYGFIGHFQIKVGRSS
jgi:hypothetical protein